MMDAKLGYAHDTNSFSTKHQSALYKEEAYTPKHNEQRGPKGIVGVHPDAY